MLTESLLRCLIVCRAFSVSGNEPLPVSENPLSAVLSRRRSSGVVPHWGGMRHHLICL